MGFAASFSDFCLSLSVSSPLLLYSSSILAPVAVGEEATEGVVMEEDIQEVAEVMGTANLTTHFSISLFLAEEE